MFWAIHLTGVRSDVLVHEPLPAGARVFRVDITASGNSGCMDTPDPVFSPRLGRGPYPYLILRVVYGAVRRVLPAVLPAEPAPRGSFLLGSAYICTPKLQ